MKKIGFIRLDYGFYLKKSCRRGCSSKYFLPYTAHLSLQVYAVLQIPELFPAHTVGAEGNKSLLHDSVEPVTLAPGVVRDGAHPLENLLGEESIVLELNHLRCLPLVDPLLERREKIPLDLGIPLQKLDLEGGNHGLALKPVQESFPLQNLSPVDKIFQDARKLFLSPPALEECAPQPERTLALQKLALLPLLLPRSRVEHEPLERPVLEPEREQAPRLLNPTPLELVKALERGECTCLHELLLEAAVLDHLVSLGEKFFALPEEPDETLPEQLNPEKGSRALEGLLPPARLPQVQLESEESPDPEAHPAELRRPERAPPDLEPGAEPREHPLQRSRAYGCVMLA